jgi:hypothetical protein
MSACELHGYSATHDAGIELFQLGSFFPNPSLYISGGLYVAKRYLNG